MPTTSPKFSINWNDAAKSFLIAALSQPILVILTSFAAGHFAINWTEQWHMAVSAGAAYLIKNFFSAPSACQRIQYNRRKNHLLYYWVAYLIFGLYRTKFCEAVAGSPNHKCFRDQ